MFTLKPLRQHYQLIKREKKHRDLHVGNFTFTLFCHQIKCHFLMFTKFLTLFAFWFPNYIFYMQNPAYQFPISKQNLEFFVNLKRKSSPARDIPN
jgi:hypothetical protein